MSNLLRRRAHSPQRVSEHARDRLQQAALMMVMMVLVGTIGYEVVEGWNLLDSLYMTVITVASVGYGETHPLSQAGRTFTIVFILSATVVVGFAISTFAAFLIEGGFNKLIRGKRMDKRIAGMKNHLILCGAGHTGTHIAAEFHKTQTPFVVVERETETVEHLSQLGDIHYVQGDATHDEVLVTAGIRSARGLITVLSEDKDNVFVVLTARALNPGLRIVARLIEDENEAKLRKAGADEVVSPNHIGGMRMASVMIRPRVVAFLDTMLRHDHTLRLEQLRVDRVSGLPGKSLAEIDLSRRSGLLVVAIEPAEGGYRFNPPSDAVLREGDVLIVMGNPEQLAGFLRPGGLERVGDVST